MADWKSMSAAGPSSDMVEFIYGGALPGEEDAAQEEYVTITRKIAADWENVGAVSPARLSRELQRIMPFLLADCYFTLNSMFMAGRSIVPATGLPYGLQHKRALKFLNAAYCDLDYYKFDPPLDWPQAVALAMRLQDEGVIPPFTIYARSGRGMYMLWLLSGKHGGRQTAFPHERVLYEQIERALWGRINDRAPELVPDKNALDATRLLRLDGSMNTAAGCSVEYYVRGTEHGAPLYTLDALASFLELRPALPRQTGWARPTHRIGACPLRARGKQATAMHRLEDVRAIEQDVGGFVKGDPSRARLLWYTGWFCKGAGMTYGQAVSECEQLAARCRPAYPSPGEANDLPVSRILRDIWQPEQPTHRIFRSATLAADFGVTVPQAERLGLASIVPDELRRRRALAPAPRERARTERRELIRTIMAARPSAGIPSTRRMHRLLADRGVDVPLRTVQRDMAALYPA